MFNIKIWYHIIVASNRSRSYNACETATLVFASDEESEAEISDSDLNFPLFNCEKNQLKMLLFKDSSNEEGDEAVATSQGGML